METLRKQSLIVLAALVATTTCCAQSAEEIVAKNIQAVGGKDLIASTKSVVVTSNIEVMGNDAPTTTYILNGKGYKSETDFQGTKIVNVISEKGSWTVNPFASATTPTALPEKEAKMAKGRMYVVPLVNYADDGGKVELLGKDSADYKLHLTNDNGVDATYFVNVNTYLIDRMLLHIEQNGQPVDVTITLSDYQKLDNGLMMPFKMQQELPQLTMTITNKKVEVNKDIDPAIFDMPK